MRIAEILGFVALLTVIGWLSYKVLNPTPVAPVTRTEVIRTEVSIDTQKFTNDLLFKYRSKINQYYFTKDGRWIKKHPDSVYVRDTLEGPPVYFQVAELDTTIIKNYSDYSTISNFKALFAPDLGAFNISYTSLIKDSAFTLYTLKLKGNYLDSIWTVDAKEDLMVTRKTTTIYRDVYIEQAPGFWDRLSVGPFIGYTLGLKSKTFEPSIGLGVTYKIY